MVESLQPPWVTRGIPERQGRWTPAVLHSERGVRSRSRQLQSLEGSLFLAADDACIRMTNLGVRPVRISMVQLPSRILSEKVLNIDFLSSGHAEHPEELVTMGYGEDINSSST